MVHIGQKIKAILEESRMPVSEFAVKINRSRTVVYNIFERKTIDSGLLDKIGQVLGHNFFIYYTQLYDSMLVKEEQPKYATKNKNNSEFIEQLQSCKKELAFVKEKYELVLKINRLLEEKNKKPYEKKEKR